ncbi:plasmid transfer ATPase TraJ [Escherichia coli DEC6A]|nr:plasmid transfer ATPase TraJ [Escherichia coli DEC6A]
MKLPDEFGTFPFARFTAEEFRYFFAWCARHRVSDIDLTGGSPVSVSRFGRRVRSSAHPLPSSIMMALSDELFGREVLPRVLSGHPVDRTIQVSGDASGRYGLQRGQRVRLRCHLIQGTSATEEKVISVTMRVIPSDIPDILTMNIEPDLLDAMLRKTGLGFICGETGSGKSTLAAALYRYIQTHFPDRKTVTYEDPVEYILGERMTFCHPIRPKSGVMWKVLRQDFALPFAVTRTSSVSVKSGIMKRQMQPSRQVTPVTSASAPCTPNHPVKPLPGCWGYFHRKSGIQWQPPPFPWCSSFWCRSWSEQMTVADRPSGNTSS